MRFPWSRPRVDPFTRNRPVLRSPVMARLDALFADQEANASVYDAILADPEVPLSAEYLRVVFDRHSPDPVEGGASIEDVITHVFEHILGAESWWGAAARGWRGEELLSAGYRDAIARAKAAGNVPIRTFHLQASSDGKLQVQVLDAGVAVIVLIATPAVPLGPRPQDYKLGARQALTFGPTDENMSEVSSYTIETLPHR